MQRRYFLRVASPDLDEVRTVVWLGLPTEVDQSFELARDWAFRYMEQFDETPVLHLRYGLFGSVENGEFNPRDSELRRSFVRLENGEIRER